MIVCHCNVLTKAAILDVVGEHPLSMTLSPVQVHKCMGCAPQCGRCLATVREILAEARITTVAAGCVVCPASTTCAHNDDHALPAVMMAAE
jgi:bacterioferritin-associated ferredoxin